MNTWQSQQSKPFLRIISSIVILCFVISNTAFALPEQTSKLRALQPSENEISQALSANLHKVSGEPRNQLEQNHESMQPKIDRLETTNTVLGEVIGNIADLGIEKAAKILSEQNSNVVFEKNARLDKWYFRRSSIDLQVPELLCDILGKILEKQGERSILLTLRKHDEKDIFVALRKIIVGSQDVESSFITSGIQCTHKFKKVLYVAPYGDPNGNPLKFIEPHLGVEKLAYISNYELDNVDARVYNPNLGSKEGLIKFIEEEGDFDVIGFSVLQIVLRSTLEMLCDTRKKRPNALIVIGGSELEKLPEEFFQAVPYDIAAMGDGMPLVKVIQEMEKDFSKDDNLKKIEQIPGLVISRDNGKMILRTGPVGSVLARDKYPNFIENIPYETLDLTHGKKYSVVISENGIEQIPIFWDSIGRNTLRVTVSDYCRGKCIYCNAERNIHSSPTIEQVMEYIRANYKGHDSIQISSVDFLYDVEYAKDLCQALIRSEFKNVPKLFVSRVNKVTPELVKLLKEAGFVAGAHGIESFDTGILRHLRKGATRETNLRTLNIELQAGIKPGVYIMFFTPWSTIKISFDTLDLCLDYVQQGAYLNLIPDIDVHLGSPLADMKDVIQMVEISYPGMYHPFVYPTTCKILDEELKQLRDRTHEIFDKVTKESNIPHPHQNSLTVYSLLVLKAFSLAYKEKYPSDAANNKRIARIDETIRHVIDNEIKTVEGEMLVFNPADYPLQAKIPSKEESSLNLEDYINSRLPEELSAQAGESNIEIEIHRGPQSYTDQYLKNMLWRGYSKKLLNEPLGGQFKIYLLERENKKIFVFSNILGPTRELTILQMLHYIGFPHEKIKIRKYDFGLTRLLNLSGLNAYAGKIEKTVITHDIDEFTGIMQRIEPELDIVEKIKKDFVNAIIVKRKNGELILVFDINYAYGKHISEIAEYLVSLPEQGGLGINEVFLKSTCGAVGKDIKLNDIVLCSDLFIAGNRVALERNMHVDEKKFRLLLPDGIGMHRMPVFTIPTVLSGSISLSKQIDDMGGGVFELEMSHLHEVSKKHPHVKFQSFFEVHDKPSIGSDREKSLGKNVPGFENKSKMDEVGESIGRYILEKTSSNVVKIGENRGKQDLAAKIINAQSSGWISEQTATDAIFLLDDNTYGDVASSTVKELAGESRWDDLDKFVGPVAGRRRNIDLIYSYLDKNKEYDGYDVIILSSKTEEEARFQEKQLNQLFEGVKTKKGKPVKIISVVEKGWGKEKKQENNKQVGAGNFLATLAAYMEACKVMPELDDLWKNQNVKIMMLHNAGEAVRDIPHSLSYDNSRGSQHMVGKIRTEDGEIPITPIIFTVLTNMGFAESNDGLSIDLFWTSEMLIPSRDLRDFTSVGDDLFGVMATEIDRNTQLTKEDLKKKGFYYRIRGESVIGYMAPNSYSDYPELLTQFIKRCDLFMQDLGGQRFSMRFLEEAIKKFKGVIVKHNMKIEIAYQVMEPMFIINEALTKYRGKVDYLSCRVEDIENILDQVIDVSGRSYLSKLKMVRGIKDKGSIPDNEGKYEENAFYKEIIDFYLSLFRRINGNSEKFQNLDILGLHDDVYWWSYRTPREKLNADYEMITDLAGKKIMVSESGGISYETPACLDIIKAEDQRRIRRIRNPVENVIINNKQYSFTCEEVKRGIEIEGVKIKGSIVRDCTLLLGSEVIDSVMEDVQGKIISKNSVIMGSIAPELKAESSNIVNMMTSANVSFFGKAVGGIFRPGIMDTAAGVEGETIFVVPIGSDGKKTNKQEFPENIASAETLGSLPCNPDKNKKIMANARSIVAELIKKKTGTYISEEKSRTTFRNYLDILRGYDSYYKGAVDPVNALNIKASRDAILEASMNVTEQGTAVISDAGRCFDIPLKELLEQEVIVAGVGTVKKFKKVYLLDLDTQATQEAVDMIGLTEDQKERVFIVKCDVSLIFSRLTGIVGSLLAEKKSLSYGEAIDDLKQRIQSFINDPENWLSLPFSNEKINLFVTSGDLASICQNFYRYLNKELKILDGWQETDENLLMLKKKFLFLTDAVARSFAKEVSRISCGVVYISSSIDTDAEDMFVLGITDLKKLFDTENTFYVISEDKWDTRISFLGERISKIQMVVLSKNKKQHEMSKTENGQKEMYAEDFARQMPDLYVAGDIREIKFHGTNRRVVLLPLKVEKNSYGYAVAVSLSWIQDYYLRYKFGSLKNWSQRYPESLQVKTEEDLANLAIWPVVDIDNPDAKVLEWVANGGLRGPPEYIQAKKISLSQFREKFSFPPQLITTFMKYPEIIALIDGIDFHFPEVFFHRDIKVIAQGKTIDKDPDWFRTFDGLPEKWKGVTCEICGGSDLRPIQIIGPSRLVQCKKCSLMFDNPQAIVYDKDLDKYSSDLRDARGESYKSMERAEQQAKIFLDGLRELRPDLEGTSLLEIGSASGEFLYILREKYGWENGKLMGVDLSSRGTDYAKKHFGLNVIKNEPNNTNLGMESFKIVVIHSSIEHMPEVKRLLRNIYLILDADGILMIGTVPNQNSLTSLIYSQGAVARNFPDGQHYYQFTPQTLSSLGRKTGFKVRKLSGQTRGYVFESVREQFFEIINYCGLRTKVPLSDEILLARLKKSIFDMKKNIIGAKGAEYAFNCNDSDFESIESAVKFWEREIKRSPYLANDFDLWFEKEVIDIEKLLPQAKIIISSRKEDIAGQVGIDVSGSLLGKDVSMPIEEFLRSSVNGVVRTGDTIAKVDPNTEAMSCLISREILNMMPDRSVAIDVGCGSGVHSLKIAGIAKRYGKDWTVLALDRNKRAVERTLAVAKESKLDKFIKGAESDLYDTLLQGDVQEIFSNATSSRDIKLIISNPPQMPAYRYDLYKEAPGKERVYTKEEIWENFDYLLEPDAEYTDGLGIIDKIINDGKYFLADGGRIVIVAFAFLGIEKIRRIFDKAGFSVNVIKLQQTPVRRNGITWHHMELIEKLSGYKFKRKDGSEFESVAEAKAQNSQIYQEICLFVGERKPKERSNEGGTYKTQQVLKSTIGGYESLTPEVHTETEGRLVDVTTHRMSGAQQNVASVTFISALSKWQSQPDSGWAEVQGPSEEEKTNKTYTVNLPGDYSKEETIVVLTTLGQRLGKVKVLLRSASAEDITEYNKLTKALNLNVTVETSEAVTNEDELTQAIQAVKPGSQERYLFIARPGNPEEYKDKLQDLDTNLKVLLLKETQPGQPLNLAPLILKAYFGQEQINIFTPLLITPSILWDELKSALEALRRA